MNVEAREFVVCVDGVCLKNGKLLLLKRTTEPFKGCWHIIGGHVEEGETLTEALRREYKEETNLNVKVGKIIDGRIEETGDRIKIIVAYKIDSAQGEVKLNSEHGEYGWFTEMPAETVYDYSKYFAKEGNKPFLSWKKKYQ